MANETTTFKRSLGLLDATMVVIGSMIGSGIFIVSADIVRTVGTANWTILAWILTGVLTLIAAISYGELSAMYPKAGGQYVYLREAYNPLVGFLYGWAFFAVIQTGTIAAVGVAFAKFSAYIFPILSEKNYLLGDENSSFKVSAAQITSIVLITFLTYVNTKGVKNGKWIQTLFTAAKVIALFALLIFGFLHLNGQVWKANWGDGWDFMKLIFTKTENGTTIMSTEHRSGIFIFTALSAAMVGSIFSSDAWNNITFIAGEVKNPQRNIGLSLLLGTLTVTVIYILMNLMYLGVMPIHDIAQAPLDRVGVAASQMIFGDIGTYFIAVLIMISTFGCNNGLILSGARVYYTMAKDNLFFKQTGTLNENAVPESGLWIQCVWASLLCLTGKYGDLLDYVTFAVLIFYSLTIGGIFILRKRLPNAERPYKALGYPILPAFYIIFASAICIALLYEKPLYTFPGLGIVLLGIPIYYFVLGGDKNKPSKLDMEDKIEEIGQS
jgi:basic amino acid/polyamine antiporter, APA family